MVINDPTHHEYERRKRDERVAAICAEAGVPIVTLWTNYGVNREYMQKRITETLEIRCSVWHITAKSLPSHSLALWSSRSPAL